jgi:nitric oxide reductase subunit B
MSVEGMEQFKERISPRWKHATIIVLVVGLAVLAWQATRSYQDAPPIPAKVVLSTGEVLFTGEDILAGQSVFLKYGLMENGTIWGHGAYLGPDFAAQYLHQLTLDVSASIAASRYQRDVQQLTDAERNVVESETKQLLKQNRYDPKTKELIYSAAEEGSFGKQIDSWAEHFSKPTNSSGLEANLIRDHSEMRQLVAFFSWTAWASVVNRPEGNYSYTNNFPFDPASGNTPPTAAYLWSALSLITLLSATGLVLFVVGKFDYLGWKSHGNHIHPQLIPGTMTESQKATIKYFVVASLLFLVQALVGAATEHYRADAGSFYGFDLSQFLPSNILRTWHLQLAIFWIATAYVAGGLLIAPSLGGREPRGQAKGVHTLFGALVLVVVGSLFGEVLGINQLLGKAWFWFGHQGWEYLDLGRAWQVLLAIGLVFWLFLLFRELKPTPGQSKDSNVSGLLLYSAIAIPLFYIPAMFFTSTTHFTVVDTWRFWIIHLWVEGFFELFVTAMVAAIFFKLGMVSQATASRVVYLDAILYLGAGIIGTGHHWYWTGQSEITMALAALFSAMEVVPLTLLTLDAWDFIKLTKGKCDICHKEVSVPHKWTFYFLMAVGVWNFVGAGVFGFLINLPIISYFEVGTMLTPNHGHAAMMGVFGMLAIALMVFAFRQATTEKQWSGIEKYLRVSFWGLNIGLALMLVTNLFPGGVLQLIDVMKNGYWHARSPEFLNRDFVKVIEWLRMPGDLIFIGLGIVPLVLAGIVTYKSMRISSKLTMTEARS